MSRTQKKKKFSAVSQVKSIAREQVGMPRASFALTPKHQKPIRHKQNLMRLEPEE